MSIVTLLKKIVKGFLLETVSEKIITTSIKQVFIKHKIKRIPDGFKGF